MKRFWERVDIQGEDDCWEWTAGREKGYGYFYSSPKMYRAHRFVWELVYGIIPEGIFVLHSCDNPPCCNPEHLFLGTQADNVADRERKGRGIMPLHGGISLGEDHGRSKLTEQEVVMIRQMWTTGYYRLADLGRMFGGMCGQNIGRIVHRKIWTHI